MPPPDFAFCCAGRPTRCRHPEENSTIPPTLPKKSRNVAGCLAHVADRCASQMSLYRLPESGREGDDEVTSAETAGDIRDNRQHGSHNVEKQGPFHCAAIIAQLGKAGQSCPSTFRDRHPGEGV